MIVILKLLHEFQVVSEADVERVQRVAYLIFTNIDACKVQCVLVAVEEILVCIEILELFEFHGDLVAVAQVSSTNLFNLSRLVRQDTVSPKVARIVSIVHYFAS